MKLKYVVGLIAAAMIGQAQASHVYSHPSVDKSNQISAEKRAMMPGYCQVEIINNSAYVLTVNGTYDDNSTVWFQIYPHESAYYLDLYYRGECHANMYLTITTPYNVVYQGYAAPGASLEYAYGLAGDKMTVVNK